MVMISPKRQGAVKVIVEKGGMGRPWGLESEFLAVLKDRARAGRER
jgi:hypothetical protein